MAQTVIGVGDPLAVKKFGAFTAVDVSRKSYWNKKFMGVGVEAETPIQTLLNLENDSGDTITFDLFMQLRGSGIEGDKLLRGTEEDLKRYTDQISIDQLRKGVNIGGKMSRKRTIHDMRKIARARLTDWWARLFDELIFIYLSGKRGTNADYILGNDYVGFAGNAMVPPDSMHLLYGGAATSKATMTAADKFDLKLIDRAQTRASTMGGGTQGIPKIQPCSIEGEEHFVAVLHDFQEYDVRTNAGAGQWLDIQKAATAAEGRNNPIFKGSLGKYNNTVLHKHNAVILDSTYGAGGNVNAARALFVGRQAAVVSFGSAGSGLRFDWKEEEEDRGNQVVITTGSIFGIKKTAFTIDGVSRDFGVIALDTAVTDPS
jgi:N4-gp56 family major capsid protein